MGVSKTVAASKSSEVGLIFDSTTRAVMAQGKPDGIREKVTAVREVVRDRSNDEITQVLTHYDNDIERTIQAFLDGDATHILMEWQHTGNKQPAKRKKNKRGAQKAPNQAAEFHPPQPLQVNSNTTHQNGDLLHSPKSLTESISSTTSSLSVLSVSDSKPPAMNGSTKQPPTATQRQIPRNQRHQHMQPPRTAEAARNRTMSEASTASDSGKRGTYAGLEKSMKDLQRQVSSLQRLRTVMSDGFDVSFKSISTTFEEFRKSLNDREAEVIFELDKVKQQTTELLSKRQRTANELKNRAMKAQLMNEKELSILRADIKHFVSERKIDEDISSTNRYLWDLEHSKQFLKTVCSVVPVKTTYQHTTPDVIDKKTQDPSPPPSAITPKADNSGAKVVTQSDSLTQFEKSGAPIADIHKAAPPRSAKRFPQKNKTDKRPVTTEMNNNHSTANKNQTTANRNQTPANRNQTTANRNQTTANRNQTTANRNQTTANKNQTTANRNLTTQAADQPTEAKKSRNTMRRERDRQKQHEAKASAKTPESKDLPTAAAPSSTVKEVLASPPVKEVLTSPPVKEVLASSPVNEALPQRKERERRPRPDLTNGET